jgi:hypothetical protein
MRTGVSRRHEHLYFAAETLVPKPRLLIAWPACQFTPSVPGNHNKFAIAVTRARVDSPSFLLLILQLCTLRISWMRNRVPKLQGKLDASAPKLNRIRELQHREPVYPESNCTPFK